MTHSPIQTQHFGVSDTTALATLQKALSKGADFAELFFQDSQNKHIILEDHSVSRAATRIDFGVGIRAIKGDQVGYAYTEDPAPNKLADAAAMAANIANLGSKPGPQALHQQSAERFYADRHQVLFPPIEAQVALLQQLDERIFQADPRIKKAQLSLQIQQDTILIINSDGLYTGDYQPLFMLMGSVVVEENGQREQNRHNLSARAGLEYLSSTEIERFVDELVRGATELFGAIRPKGGQMEVVLGAGGSGILLHEAIGHGLEADFNRKNLSIFSDKMGQAIAAPFVTIVDDGTLHGNRGAINIDDEGTPGQRTTLVENGILTSYLHDRLSAQHYGVAPTGNGRRQSFRFEPMPRMRNTYMLAGNSTRNDIIASVQNGIFADSFANGQVNIGAGDFTFYVKSGFLIENGRLTQRIKDVNIIGNGPEVLANISMVANDTEISAGGWACGKRGQSVPVSIGIPTVKAGKLTVGGQ